MKTVLYILLGLTLAAMTGTASASSDKSPDKRKSEGKHGSAYWSYKGSEGPNRWGTLDPAYAVCRTGTKQSPIDIKGKLKSVSKELKFSYKNTKLRVLNNGHTIQVDYDIGSVLDLGGDKYRLAQFHFHSPSEHLVKGRPYDMEMHLVHVNRKRQLAVVGVLLKIGRASPTLERIWRRMPTDANVKIEEVGTKISVRI